MPDNICRALTAVVPGVGEGLITCGPEAEFPPSRETSGTLALQATSSCVDERDFKGLVSELLHVEQEVPEELCEVLVPVSVSEVRLDDDDSYGITSDSFCIFFGGSPSPTTTTITTAASV